MKNWNELSIRDKNDIIKVAVQNGITTLPEIRERYNEFAEGGYTEEERPPIVPFAQRNEVVVTPDYEYNQYLNTLPDNQRFTPNSEYDSHLYWKLNGRPRNFEEAYNRGMFDYNNADNSYHAHSISWGRDGVGYFMKPKDHKTLQNELDWFNNGLVTNEDGSQRPETPEEKAESDNFRRNYRIVDDPNRPNFLMYQPMNGYSSGGKIHIKDSKKGTFTAAASKHGMGVQAFASKVLAHKENYSPAMVKKANFARNASKWHGYGGNLFGDGGEEDNEEYYPIWLDGITVKPSGNRPTTRDDWSWANWRELQNERERQAAESVRRGIDRADKIGPVIKGISDYLDTPIMIQANPGTATAYSSFGQYMPQTESTIGTEVGNLVNIMAAPTMLSDIKGLYNVGRAGYNIARNPVSWWRSTPEEWSLLTRMAKGTEPAVGGITSVSPNVRYISSDSPDINLSLLERPRSNISEAERVGIPKGERNNVGKDGTKHWYPEITKKNAHKISDEQWDDAYWKAIADKNIVEAQRLRDLHFYAKSGNTPSVQYRGSGKGNRNTYFRDDGSAIWFTPDREGALFYGHNPREVYIKNGDNVLSINGQGTSWSKIPESSVPEDVRPYINFEQALNIDGIPGLPNYYNATTTSDIVHGSKLAGYDQVTFDNVIDSTSKGVSTYKQVATRNPNSIKLRNVVTRDDAGNVIPLSKRDNFNNPDIRYGLLPWVFGGGTGIAGYEYLNQGNGPLVGMAMGGRLNRK